MSSKRILLLGGAYAQIPMIMEAVGRGYYVMTCDYLPDNPGHQLAHEYHNVSTTDFKGVLQLARKLNPDLVVAYASDPAAQTAAYVSEQLDLPGNSFRSVRLLSEKDLFRKLLTENRFNVPEFMVINEGEDPEEILSGFALPFIMKPTDSSGSKGITKVDHISGIKRAFEYAMQFSRNRRIIAEEYIGNEMGDIHGDGFVNQGELVFSCLGDHIYSNGSNPFNPCGTLWPSNLNNIEISGIEEDVRRIIRYCGFTTGSVNIEARLDEKGKRYIMEIGARNGGHFVPQAIKKSSGFDMVKAVLDALTGEPVKIPLPENRHTAYYALHSNNVGMLSHIRISDKLKPFISEFHQYVKPGDEVQLFNGANAAVGVLLLEFNSRHEMEYYISNMDQFIHLEILQENEYRRIF
jgi:biotin carboxylase